MTTATLAAAVAEDALATGVLAVLTNPAPSRRRDWTPVAVPFGALTDQRLTFLTNRGLPLRAIRCEDVGQHSTIYRVFAPFDPFQTLSGEFVSAPSTQRPDPFKFHPWVVDAPTKLIPKLELRLRVNGQSVSFRTNEPFELMETEFQNDCMLRFHFVSKLGTSGFVAEGWVTFYDNSPVADVRVAVVWADPTNPAHDMLIEGLFFLTGEPVVFDFAKRTGMTELPVFNGQHWVTLVCGPLSFIDGSGLPLIGRMVCLPESPSVLPDYDPETYSDTDPAAQAAQDVETIIAAAHFPAFGVCGPRTWNGKMLAHRNIPRFGLPQEHVEAMADQALDNFFNNTIRTAGQFYDLRPISIGKSPGQTGDQQDFGAAKGWEATVAADPRWLHLALYSVTADFFRGVMHYESNGARLNPAQHPQWVTWSGRTHYSASVSPDRIGKGPGTWGAGESTGWWGYDDEHRSQTNLATLYALTGDPLLRYIIEHYSTTDIANVRHRLEFGIGAPRAVGRTLHCWANFALLFPPSSPIHQRFRQLIDTMAFKTQRDWLGGKFAGPVDIISDRTDPRMGITHNGVVLPAWSCWEHGLFAVGVYAAWKVTRDERLLDIVRRVCRTIVRYACFRDSLGWTFISTCHWPKPGVGPTGVAEGEPLPAQWYSRNSTLVTPLNGDVSTWTQNAVLIFIELHEANDPDMARAQEIAANYMPSNPNDPRTAEWQACVRSIPPVPGDWRNY
jgi:hypothetical protein